MFLVRWGLVLDGVADFSPRNGWPALRTTYIDNFERELCTMKADLNENPVVDQHLAFCH